MMKRLLCTGSKPSVISVLVTACDLDVTRLSAKYNVLQWPGQDAMPRDELIKHLDGVQGILCLLRDRIDADILNAAKDLRVISTLSVGYDHIDLDVCKQRGIAVGNTPDVLTETTAETTVALLLTTARRIVEAVDEARTGKWGAWSLYYMCGVSIHDSTVGIVGLGRIGLSVAEKLRAFKPARILYHNRKPNNERATKVGAEYVSIEELFKESDFLVFTCSYTPDMEKMINKNTFAMMKKNAIIINSSRGSLIDQNDLYEALSTDQIRGAGLDVTTPEPLPVGHPLFSLRNCVIFPHIGSASETVRSKMYQMAVDNLMAVLDNGSAPLYPVV